jgi:hypothetical protein
MQCKLGVFISHQSWKYTFSTLWNLLVGEWYFIYIYRNYYFVHSVNKQYCKPFTVLMNHSIWFVFNYILLDDSVIT